MLGPHTVTRLRAETVTDEYDNELPGGPDVALEIPGCSVQPGSGGEYHDAREAVTVTYTAWLPGLPDVRATDRIAYDGETYNIDGSPERWNFPPHEHTVIRLKAVD